MASISNTKGFRTIQFVAADGKRKSIRLGKMSKRLAEEIKVKVEALNAAGKSGLSIDGETATWLNKIGDDLADKLATVGLIQARRTLTLGQFLSEYICSRSDIKAGTRRNDEVARKCLLDYFGTEKAMGAITQGDADDYARYLRVKGFAPATLGRRIKRVRQFFRAAMRKRLITENPFADVIAPAQVNEARKVYVSRETIENCILAAPDAEWRLILALARYGGMRTPSETLTLKLADINWERDRITVHSPKTEHLPGGEYRVIPLFAELKPYLEEVFELAQPGQVYLITRYRDLGVNLRTHFLRIIRRAGEKPWPKLFHNLRASRQTDLADSFPAHVVCDWLGNSEVIAERHYLQTTEQHFAKAIEGAAKSGADRLQKAVQQPSAMTCNDPQELEQVVENYRDTRDFAIDCSNMQNVPMTPTGFEPVSRP